MASTQSLHVPLLAGAGSGLTYEEVVAAVQAALTAQGLTVEAAANLDAAISDIPASVWGYERP